MSVPPYAVTFRGLPACPCLATWLPAYESELQRRRQLDGALRIYQLIGGAEASGGTHASGGAFDITDLVGDADVWVARQMGADATWARTPAQGFTPHLHGVLTGCPHNGPAAYQIDAVRDGYNGLGRGGRGARDDGPRPLSGRTWREGLEWARQQREDDDMAFTDWSDDERAAFRKFIQNAVRFTPINTYNDATGETKPVSLDALLREIEQTQDHQGKDIAAIKKKLGA